MVYNRIIIVGRLVKDPEARALPDGEDITRFTVATNQAWSDKNGQKQESSEFHTIVCVGDLARTMGKLLKQSSLVLVEGRKQTRTWEDRITKEPRKTVEIIADTVQYLDPTK